MKLKALLKDIPFESIKGSKEIEITGITSNSKGVGPGNLFIAKKGSSGEGHKFIQEAIGAGAAAILTDIYNPFLTKVVQILHSDVASLEGAIAANYYKNPSDQLFIVGITGTSGKTTTSFLVKHLLDSIGKPCGLIGTIEYIVGQTRYKASLTTPDVISNHKLLKEMVADGCKACVMEVSSHALEQGRVNNIEYDAAIFTNLSHDHLDYHGTMEEYLKAKAKLFASLKEDKVAILNKDSGIQIDCPCPVLTYGISHDADVRAGNIILSSQKTVFDVRYKQETVPFTIKLIGKFNILNCLAVIALGLSMNLSLTSISRYMESAEPVPGRLDSVVNQLGLNIYVDYSHKPDALKNVLETLQELKTGRIITVFGCGGNRDKHKRPEMASIAEKLSDTVIVTSDNPRDEDPLQIIEEIKKGFSSDRYLVEVDRRSAIEKAIQMARPSDIILIAGKGHEPYQIFAHKTIEFDDKIVASEICNLVKTC